MHASARFAGRVAVVTGGGRGIGRAVAERLATEGAMVVIGQRSAEEGESAVAAIRANGGTARSFRLDVCSEESVQAFIETVLGTVRRLDILCNNAGSGVAHSATETSVSEFQSVMQTNVLGPLLCTKHAAAHLASQSGASIVNVSSVAGLVGLTSNAPYCASKGAVVTLTKQMALDMAPLGVRVNCVCPGFVQTAQMEAFLASRQDPTSAREAAVSLHPLGRLGQPDDVASAVAFLASDDASFITGAVLAVDGGYLAQ